MIDLNEKEYDVLKHIFITGGYTTIDNLSEYLNLDRKSTWRILDKLSSGNMKERYLNKPNEETRLSREKLLYQVNTKTCRLFNNPNCYYRKKHSREYIHRNLLKNLYFSRFKNKKHNALFLHYDKLNYLYELGYTDNELPHKIVGKDKIYGVEDVILAKENVIEIIYFDKESVFVKKQCNSLIYTYSSMIAKNIKPIKFTIVTTNSNRKQQYIINLKTLKELVQLHKIDNNLLQIYTSYLKTRTVDEKEKEIILENYKNGIIEKAVLERISSKKFDIKLINWELLDNIFTEGIQYLINHIKTLLQSKKYNVIDDIFTQIFSMNYEGILLFSNKEPLINICTIEDKLL